MIQQEIFNMRCRTSRLDREQKIRWGEKFRRYI